MLWETKVDRKMCYPLLLFLEFFIIGFFSETQKGSSTNCFGTVRPEIFDGKLWHPPPLWSLNFFCSRKFLEHRGFLVRNVSVLWDEKTSWENRDTPLIWISVFDTRKQWNTQGLPYENFQYCERQKKSTDNYATPFLIQKIFQCLNAGVSSEAQKCCSTNCFRTVRQKPFDLRSWYPPPVLLNFFFRYQKFSETQKGSSKKSFETETQNIFNKKSCYNFLCMNFFDTRN